MGAAVQQLSVVHAKIDIGALSCGQEGTEVASDNGRNSALTTALPMMCTLTQLGGSSEAACRQFNQFCDWSPKDGTCSKNDGKISCVAGI